MNTRSFDTRAAIFGVAVALVCAAPFVRTQSLSYTSGQNASPAFEGFEENEDGSFSMVFGYMNRNWQEELDVPVGPENNVEPGGPDQGQPTHFLPRRNRFVFRVRVPKDFGTKEMVWTLTTKGKTEKAYASLKTDYRLEPIDLMSETGALGAGSSSPEVRSNKPPVVRIEGSKTLTAKVGQPLKLSAIVTDDGLLKPRGLGGNGNGGRGGGGANAAGNGGGGQGVAGSNPFLDPAAASALAARGVFMPAPPTRSTVGKATGLHAGWFVYRGAGKVRFSPDQIETWEDTREGANSPWAPRWVAPPAPADGRSVAEAVFDQPGTYVLRCLADDGGLFGGDDVTVQVSK